MRAECPVCVALINLDGDTVENELIECPECGTELEVKSVNENTATVEEAPQEGEDWGE